MNETKGYSSNGYVALAVMLATALVGALCVVFIPMVVIKILAAAIVILSLGCLVGFYMVQPNEARVLTLFGSYIGTVIEPGLRWSNPLCLKKKVSLRIRNFETNTLKVNDSHGNPIEIGSVIVWCVDNTAEAVFDVDNYESFVSIQSEAALRSMASVYPYDLHEGDDVSLRSHPEIVSNSLVDEVQKRLNKAGIKIIEARISHLAYAAEIASAMLQRQQASAIVAARHMIVDGAVGMVEMALNKLSEKGVVELDEERKAVMVSNLLVVLCGDKSAQPVVNSGSLY